MSELNTIIFVCNKLLKLPIETKAFDFMFITELNDIIWCITFKPVIIF